MNEELTMPQVFLNLNNETKSARMFSPSKITSLSAWYKAARVVIPAIPDTTTTDWYVADEEATVTKITYRLLNGRGDQAWVVIDRVAPGPMT